MKLKQLEGLLGDLEQFSNPKVCEKRLELWILRLLFSGKFLV